MLPPILNSPEWLISPNCHQKWEDVQRRRSPIAQAYAWAPFHFELWEGQSVSEVFEGVQGAGPLEGLQGGSAPLPKKILYLEGIRCAISLTFFLSKIPEYSHQIIQKNVVRHRKHWAFENERTKKKLTNPFQLIKKVYGPPFSSSKKLWPTPIFYCPPPVEIMNVPLVPMFVTCPFSSRRNILQYRIVSWRFGRNWRTLVSESVSTIQMGYQAGPSGTTK